MNKKLLHTNIRKETPQQEEANNQHMALVIVLDDLDKAMAPFNTKMQQIIEYDEKKKKHSDATKKGQEGWLKYRNYWLNKFETEFPDAFDTYNEKISHIAVLWRIRKKSIASRLANNLNRLN